MEAYDAALRCNPDDKEAILNRTNAYYETNQLYRAEDDLLYLISSLPDSSDLHFRLGLVHAKMHRFDAAVKDFNTSLQLDPENAEALINRGTVYYYKNDLPKARKDLYQARSIGIQMGNVYNGLALVAAESDSLDRAIAMIERALAEEPLQPYFLNNRGFIHLLRGEYELAREDIDRSITLDPANAWAYRNKARYYHLQGEYEEAIRLYEQALSTNTFIQKINVFLGDSYLASGNHDRACELYREGVKM
ncbi:MAG: tetratricopeptide repeat protein, partial [Cyclobacteriaceae bacterium]